MAVAAGTRLGRFLIREYVGQGELGLVYRATEPAIGSVAVKVLFGLGSAESLQAFRALMPRLARFHHPNVTTIFDHGEHAGVPYLVVDHVAGGSLADRPPDDPLGWTAALWILQGVAGAIDLAHDAGFVHSALTTRQVLLDVGGRPVVTDLGIAGLEWPHPDGVTVVAPPARAAYTAPELVAGGAPSAAADRYAFATIAYELLTGRTPFQGASHAVMNAQLDAEPVAPSSLRPGLDPRVDAVLLRGLAKDAEGRWRRCGELVEALAAARETGGRLADIVLTPGPRSRSRRGRRVLTAAGVAMLALGGALVVSGGRHLAPVGAGPGMGIAVGPGATLPDAVPPTPQMESVAASATLKPTAPPTPQPEATHRLVPLPPVTAPPTPPRQPPPSQPPPTPTPTPRPTPRPTATPTPTPVPTPSPTATATPTPRPSAAPASDNST